jgi:putative pyruvate formate lyase activating enzyme
MSPLHGLNNSTRTRDAQSPWIRARRDFTPAYLQLYEKDKLIFDERAEEALRALVSCEVCPRDCHINRLEDKHGVCRTGRYAYVGSAFPHFGEEDCLRGRRGSGTIFFSFCNLKCVFCQNFDFSWRGHGQTVTFRELAQIMLSLQKQGCHNINFVTPEHVVPQIMEAIPLAIEAGLRLPIVYNTSAYDSMHSLRLMEDIVDIYMPDFKFWDPKLSRLYMAAENYPDAARAAIKEMHRQVGPLTFDEEGIALCGVLLRHLVMPNRVAGTREIFRFIAREVSKDTFVNIMGQYHPAGKVLEKPDRYPAINRAVSSGEYFEAVKTARQEGLYRFDER